MFEKNIKQQFEDLEYKPSESLWDKIAAELPEDQFENVIAEKVNSFKPKANPEIWNAIENQLPKQRGNSYAKFLIPLLFLFFVSAAYLGYQFSNKKLGIGKESLNGQTHHASEHLTNQKNIINQKDKPINYREQLEKKKNNLSKNNARKNIVGSNNISENKMNINRKSQKPISKNIFKNPVVNNESSVELSGKDNASADIKNTIQPEQNQNPISNISLSETKPEIVSNNLSAKVDSTIALNIPPIVEQKNNMIDSVSSKKSVQKITNEEKLTKFSISIISGIQVCYNRISAPSNSRINFTENIALRKNIETPMLDWNGAFLLDYAFNENLRVSTGMMISNFSQQFHYAVQTPTGNHSAITDPSAIINNPNDSIVNGSSYNNRIKYTWTEIPLFITYSFKQKHKIGVEITSGISYAIISGVDASYVSYDNIGVIILNDKNSFPGVKNNFFFHFYPSVTYKLNELVQIGIAPTFKYSINSITENENWVQQQPYFIGLSAMLRKKF